MGRSGNATRLMVGLHYRGHDYAGGAKIYKQDGRVKALTHAIRNKLRRRSAIEPIIGHVKSDNGMARNFLKNAEGDRLNAILAAAGYNMRKLLAAFLYALRELASFLENQLRVMSKNLCRPRIHLALLWQIRLFQGRLTNVRKILIAATRGQIV